MPSSAPRKILLLHTGALGDCVLTLHVAASLRQAFPTSRVEMCARSPFARFAADRGLLQAAFAPEPVGLHRLHGDERLPTELVQFLNDFDLLINFCGGRGETFSKRLLQCVERRAVSVDPRPNPHQGDTHIVQQWLDHLSAAGLDLSLAHKKLIHSPPDKVGAARSRLEVMTGTSRCGVVICHPGSGSRSKCCPLDIFELVVARLRKANRPVLWMLGPTELDWHGRSLLDRLEPSAPVLFEESVNQAAALLCGADVFIGNDAGMTHVAAGLGLGTLAMFGPTNPAVWSPIGPMVETLRFGSSDTLKIKTERGDHRLIDEMVAGAERLLRAANTPPPSRDS